MYLVFKTVCIIFMGISGELKMFSPNLCWKVKPFITINIMMLWSNTFSSFVMKSTNYSHSDIAASGTRMGWNPA